MEKQVQDSDDEQMEIKDNTDEPYKFTTPVNRSLSKILEIAPFIPEKISEWKIPNIPGLSNSGRIVPIYYDKPQNKILTIHYMDMITDDIRNCRSLNIHQLEYIKKLDDEKKNELFDIFNECLKFIEGYLAEK